MLVNVPIGVAVATAAWLAVPHTPRRHGRFDLAAGLHVLEELLLALLHRKPPNRTIVRVPV